MRHITTLISVICCLATALTGCTCSRTVQQPTETPATEITSEDTSLGPDTITLAIDYAYFGQIGSRARVFAEDSLKFPPIPGLVHKSVLATCPTDTCFTEYATLALRCPKAPALLKWVSEQAKLFADECPIGNRYKEVTGKEKDIPFKSLNSADAICSYYTEELGKVCQDWVCDGGDDHDHDIPNEQMGLLLFDCYQKGQYCTFHEATWYDAMSCGDNTREAFRTIDSKTGKVLGLNDFVDEKDYDAFTALMIPRLKNRSRSFVGPGYTYSEEDKWFLEQISGIGLIKEGLIVTYFPYVLSSGADGHFHAVIPYEDLKGILKI